MMRMTPFDEMDRLFEQMRRSMLNAGFDVAASVGLGATNLHLEAEDDAFVVRVDLPGFDRDEIDLRFDEDDGELTIAAEHVTESGGEQVVSARSRRVHDRVRIPGTVLVDEIEASYRNGVLEVRLPTEETTEDADEDDEGRHRIDIE